MTDRPPSHSALSEQEAFQIRPSILAEADVLITAAIVDRPARQPNLAAENQAFAMLAQQLTDEPQSRLKTLVQIARDLCQTDTVGVSLLETLADGSSVLCWVAIAGALESWEQTTTPSNFSPCGTTIHCGQPQLYARPERYFTYLRQSQFPIIEGLLIPICANDQPLGTLWILSHTEQRLFDREDLRLMTSLAGFAAAALQSIHLRQTAELVLQAEQAWQESEAFNHSIFQSSADCIKVLDLDGCLLSMNGPGRCLMEVEDFTPLVGIAWVKFWQDSEQANAAQAVETAKAGGMGQFSGYCPTLKGTPKWWDVVVTPVLDVLGQTKQLLVVSRDISDRKQAEQALRQSEERFQAFMNHSPTAAWITDRDGRILYLSQTYFRIFQFPTQDVIGKTVFDLYPTAIAQQFLDNIQQAADTQTVVETTEVAPRSDGTMGDFLVYKFPIDDKSGAALVGGVAIDITDRKQAEEALRNSAEQLSLALTAAKLGDWSWDAATDIVTLSEQAAETFGIPPGPHMTWTQMQDLIHPDDRERARSQVEQAIANHSDYDVEYRVIHSDQTERWVAAKGRAQYDPLGQLLGMLGVVQDVSHRKQAEVERERLLAREKAARVEAETANRIKDEFLAVLSHELRSPLNPILGWVGLLRSGKLDPVRTTEALATIERNAKLQSQLIEDLLDISRIMQGKLVLNAAPVSLTFVISSAIETVRLASEAKNVGIEVHVEPNISQVSGDAGRLQQVVWNLLSNAVKFTPPGGRVDLRLTQVNHRVRLQVIDTGKGIASEFLPYVFEHFRQEDGATTRKFGGLGLGLAIAKQIVTLHGGRIWVESLGENQGATFTVELPCLQFVNSVEEVTNPILVQSDTLPLTNLRVLIVDDEPDSREFVVFVVEQAGAEVTAVSSAIEALQRLSTTPFDFLLSDIGMPEMDGYELMRQLSQISGEPSGQVLALAQPVDLPAIALTAYAGEMNQQQALAAGFQGHLTKPVEPDELIKAIITMMGSNRVEVEPT